MLGGYMWSASVNSETKVIDVSTYLYISGKRKIPIPDGVATIRMKTEMPWKGGASWELSAPKGWSWRLNIPIPAYAQNVSISAPHESHHGFATVKLDSTSTLRQEFDFTARLISPHPLTGQDTLAVTRGPIVYTLDSADNESLEKAYPHFQGIGLSSKTTFTERSREILGCKFIQLEAEGVFALEGMEDPSPYRDAASHKWKKLDEKLIFTPWFSRCNAGGAGRLRTMLLRVP
jgi:uncharacterized protein